MRDMAGHLFGNPWDVCLSQLSNSTTRLHHSAFSQQCLTGLQIKSPDEETKSMEENHFNQRIYQFESFLSFPLNTVGSETSSIKRKDCKKMERKIGNFPFKKYFIDIQLVPPVFSSIGGDVQTTIGRLFGNERFGNAVW